MVGAICLSVALSLPLVPVARQAWRHHQETQQVVSRCEDARSALSSAADNYQFLRERLDNT